MRPYSRAPEGHPLRHLAEHKPACAGRATGYAAVPAPTDEDAVVVVWRSCGDDKRV